MSKPHLCSDRRSRRVFLADTSMGLTGLALGALLPQKAGAAEDNWMRSGRQAALSAESQARHLAVHAGRREPRRVLRSQAGAEQIRRQAAFRDAAQRRALESLREGKREGVRARPARYQADALSDADRLQAARQERRRCLGLVPAHGRHDAGDLAHPLHVDHGQRSRRDPAVPHRPPYLRWLSSDAWAPGCTTGWGR